MAWVLLDDNFPNHPKAVQAGPVAAYLFVCGLCYCRRFHTNGFIPRKALPMLGLSTSPRRMVDALVEAGLWDVTEDGWKVHDYEGFYADEEDKAMKQAVAQQRREAGRKGGRESGRIRVLKTQGASSCASSTGGNGTGEGSSDQYVEEKKREADFGAFWNVYPRKDGKQKAREAWMRLRPNDETQRAIAADLERRVRSSQWLKEGGQFIPYAGTYLNQRRWEDGFEERPRLAERTINVLRGFEDVQETA